MVILDGEGDNYTTMGDTVLDLNAGSVLLVEGETEGDTGLVPVSSSYEYIDGSEDSPYVITSSIR
jgi:hypothetical protein